jgi:hypothetical protein
MYGPFQKNCNVGQVSNLPETRQIGNLPYVAMLQYYWNGPYHFVGSYELGGIRWATSPLPGPLPEGEGEISHHE